LRNPTSEPTIMRPSLFESTFSSVTNVSKAGEHVSKSAFS
jgi:hypothetical protein